MDNKEELRKRMLEIRKGISKEGVLTKSKKIEKKISSLEEFKRAKRIAAYVPIRNEVDLQRMIKKSLDEREVYVPSTDNKITFVRFYSFDELEEGKFGIPEPKIKNIIEPEKLDIIIVPGVAFDKQGHRIGYGKGYYDKILKETKALRIGVCFDFQVVERILNDTHDERMDMVITDKRVIVCSR